MGKKIHPKILRIGTILRSWDSKWFADDAKDYRTKLTQDLLIRRYLDRQMRGASISRVEISRQPRETILTIHTSRPALVIGRGGSGIEKLQKDIAKVIGKKFPLRINVQEVRNPDTDASSVATQIVDQLEKRMPFRRILKQSIGRSMQAGARGIRIALAGRLNGSEIARTEWLADGNVPLHTFRNDISFARKTAHTTYGTIGVKVWISRGEYRFDEEDGSVQQEAPVAKAPARRTRRRSSLADKAGRPGSTGRVNK